MAKKKTVTNEAAVVGGEGQTEAEVKAEASEVLAEKVEASEAPVAEKVEASEVPAETPVTEQVAAETPAARMPMAEQVAGVAGEVTSFVKLRVEQVQQRLGSLEAEAQRTLRSLVERSRESANREVTALLQRLNEGAQHLREKMAVQALEQRAIRVGGALRERLDGLQSRVVQVVGGVASQSQVDRINRELDRLSRKLDELVPSSKAEPTNQDTPQA